MKRARRPPKPCASTSARATSRLREGLAIGRVDREALRDLRRARSRRYLDPQKWIDTLYRVYLIAIFGALAVALISGALGDARADQDAIDEIAARGPALLGLLVALGAAGGLRSGARGGPLAIEAADVQHVLLAPVDRSIALRGLALRQLRTAVFVGAVVGAVIGNFAFRRLPGEAAEWLASTLAFFSLLPVVAIGSALIASGRRMRVVSASLVGVGIVCWSLADVYLETVTSPASMLGELAVWPLAGDNETLALPFLGVIIALVVVALALRWVGGTSLEAARRRADLTTELRFALTLQDLRTVILLRRQLASELPRTRPWARLPSGGPWRDTVWRRDWQSFLRWPAVRVARACVLGAVAGLAACGAWEGTTPLVLVAALALLVAGFDAVEPLAQEVDHPTRRDLIPLAPGRLIRRHLVAPTALMLGVLLIGVATAFLLTRAGLAVEVGAVIALPTALLVLCAVGLGSTNDPYAYMLNPTFGYAQTALPFALATLSVLPVLSAREAVLHGYSAVEAAMSSEFLVVLVSLAAIWWLGRRIAGRVSVKP
jgi:hypothetical protein